MKSKSVAAGIQNSENEVAQSPETGPLLSNARVWRRSGSGLTTYTSNAVEHMDRTWMTGSRRNES